MRYNLILIDDDFEYGKAMLNTLVEKYSDYFNVTLFTDISYLNNQNNKENDVVLINANLLDDTINIGEKTKIILLVDNSYSKNYEECKYIFKYQSIDSFVKQLFEILSDYTKNNKIVISKNNKQGKIIGIFSPQGGCGKSTLSVAISQILNIESKKVLYLSFDECSSNVFFNNCSKYNLSDLLYYNMLEDEKFFLKLESVQSIDESTGIYYFFPPCSSQDIQQLESKDIMRLINRLQIYYDYIVVDMLSILNTINKIILSICHMKLLMITSDMFGTTKLHNFIKNKESDEIYNDVVLVVNKCTDVDEKDQYIKINQNAIFIPYDDDLYIKKMDKYIINTHSIFFIKTSALISQVLKEDDEIKIL